MQVRPPAMMKTNTPDTGAGEKKKVYSGAGERMAVSSPKNHLNIPGQASDFYMEREGKGVYQQCFSWFR